MNLIWLTPEFPSSKSNINGMYIYRTVKELAKYYKVYVLCLYPAFPPILNMIKYWRDWKSIYYLWKNNYPRNSEAPAEFADGQIIYLRYYRLPKGKFRHIEGWFAYIQARKYLIKIIDTTSIIHANFVFPAGTMARIISRKYNVPFLISLLGSDIMELIEGSKFWNSTKKLLKQAHKVTAVSNELFDKCAEMHIEIESSKKELIDNIYEADKFIIKNKNKVRELLRIDMNVKVIFFAGSLVPIKNVDILIEAVFNIFNSRSDVNLFIAGSGIDEGILKRLVENKRMKDKIFFLGPLLSENLINYYNAADVFCLPSKSEGLPNVIVESFFCGTPVVASAVGGIPTIVKEGVNGFLVKPNSIEELENKIKISLEYSWNRESIRESVSFLFPEKVIEKYHNIYKSLAENFRDTKR
jgi:teichuronic acid biosynthesis glycosyltransferase TuaC